MRSLLNLAAMLLGMYLAWLGLLYVSQRSMMFPGAGMAWRWDPQALRDGAEAVTLTASFGSVQGVFLTAPTGAPAPAVIYFHGNAEFVDQNIELLRPITAFGVHVLLVEYPGYAGGDGRPSRESLAEAARVGFDWLAGHVAVDPRRIVSMGRSIGSGPAVELAGERDIAALVLLSPFASLDMMARSMGAPGFLLRDRYDNRVGLAAFDGPVLLFHGRADDIIPYAHSQALLSNSPGATLETLPCRHNDCPYFDSAFMHTLAQFLRQSALLGMPAQAGD